MQQKHNVTVPGLGITFSTGTYAGLANGAVNVCVGETNVFVTACIAQGTKPGQDFFPLTVDYREKYAAAGRFPGGYFKREGRPSEKEILTSRLCDRPCRPLFPEGLLNEVQIIGQLMSADQVNDSDISMVNGASAALAISDIPWGGPIGCVRVALIDGQFVANPTHAQMAESDLDLVYVGNDKDIVMYEGAAKEISEPDFNAALKWAHEVIQPQIQAQKELAAKAGKPKRNITVKIVPDEILAEAKKLADAKKAAEAKKDGDKK